MQFGLSESQQILKDTAQKFFAGECAIAEVRRLMETDTAFDAALWRKMAEQGFTGIIFPEDVGGMGLGIVELILLIEEAGGKVSDFAGAPYKLGGPMILATNGLIHEEMRGVAVEIYSRVVAPVPR